MYLSIYIYIYTYTYMGIGCFHHLYVLCICVVAQSHNIEICRGARHPSLLQEALETTKSLAAHSILAMANANAIVCLKDM